MSYLKETIGDIVKKVAILDPKKASMEVDPTRLEKNEKVKENMERLTQYSEKIIEAIFEAKNTIPR